MKKFSTIIQFKKLIAFSEKMCYTVFNHAELCGAEVSFVAIRINLGVWNRIFAVPSVVADSLKLTNGDHLKVLLCILGNAGKELTPEEIGNLTGVGAGTVADALIYWQNMNILSEVEGELMPPENTPVTSPAPAPTADRHDAQVRVKLTADTHFPPKEVATAVNNDEAFKFLCQSFERRVGRPLRHSERNVLMVLTEEVGLPVEVAAMLVEYCFSIDKATPAYMKSVALDWYSNGIDSIEKAEERMVQLKTRNSLENRLHSRFRMTSAFSSKQREFISGWAEMNLSEELIDEAYERTLDATGKLSFPYMDTILRSWNDKGITSPEQLVKDSKPSQPIDSTASFDISMLEQSAYERYRKKS